MKPVQNSKNTFNCLYILSFGKVSMSKLFETAQNYESHSSPTGGFSNENEFPVISLLSVHLKQTSYKTVSERIGNVQLAFSSLHVNEI